jgi:hypothetical protein
MVDRLGADHRLVEPGTITSGMIRWTAAEGPYLVTEPLTVRPDATLRVEAGTDIRFGVLGGLKIEGGLEVVGEPDKPVRFVPLTDDPTRDWWAGIELAGGDPPATRRLSHCLILGAEVGLRARGGAIRLDHCTLDRCGSATIEILNRAEVEMTACTVTGGYRVGADIGQGSLLRMTDCAITGMTTHGTLLKEVSGDSVVRQTRITKCGWDGVLIRGRCAPMIDNCEIADNGGNGVHGVEQASPEIVNTEIRDNGGVGILLEERWDNVIRANTVAANQGGGVIAKVRCNGEIADNRIERNGQVGLLLELDCAPMVTGNRLRANQGPGLLLRQSRPASLKDNQFVDNEGPSLRNESASEVQAVQNWWGSVDEAKIAASIEDRRVNPEWGAVVFKPWLAEPPMNSHTRPAGG